MTMKLIALAAATFAATASIASANNALPFGETLQPSDTLSFDTVRADQGGILEIYDYQRGTRGALLGTQMLNPGVNLNVKVDVGIAGNSDVLAVLSVGGNEVLTKQYDIN